MFCFWCAHMLHWCCIIGGILCESLGAYAASPFQWTLKVGWLNFDPLSAMLQSYCKSFIPVNLFYGNCIDFLRSPGQEATDLFQISSPAL